jgi:hypothetical protein
MIETNLIENRQKYLKRSFSVDFDFETSYFSPIMKRKGNILFLDFNLTSKKGQLINCTLDENKNSKSLNCKRDLNLSIKTKEIRTNKRDEKPTLGKSKMINYRLESPENLRKSEFKFSKKNFYERINKNDGIKKTKINVNFGYYSNNYLPSTLSPRHTKFNHNITKEIQHQIKPKSFIINHKNNQFIESLHLSNPCKILRMIDGQDLFSSIISGNK